MNNLQFITLGDFLDSETTKTLEIGCARFVPENKTIIVSFIVDNQPMHFEIDTERQNLLNWLEHLDRKNWATSEMIGDVFRVWKQNVTNSRI